jgi:hypothetical protein
MLPTATPKTENYSPDAAMASYRRTGRLAMRGKSIQNGQVDH